MLETKSLRDLADQGYGFAGAYLHKSADEIDRLRAELANLQGKWDAVARLWNTPEPPRDMSDA